jgi:L-amino acid N-acyltransferase YncA
MFVRLAQPDECEEIVEMARTNAALTKNGHIFSADRVREVFASYLSDAHPTIFVAEDRREIVGFLSAEIGLYDFTDGIFTIQKVLFVKPEKRGSRASVLLMKHLDRWSRQLGAKEIVGGNDNGFQSDRTARFLEHLGFVNVGYAMAKDLRDGK